MDIKKENTANNSQMSSRWRVVTQCYHIPRILNIPRRPISIRTSKRNNEFWNEFAWNRIEKIKQKIHNINKKIKYCRRKIVTSFFLAGKRNDVSASKHGSATSTSSKFPSKCDRQDLNLIFHEEGVECTFLTFLSRLTMTFRLRVGFGSLNTRILFRLWDILRVYLPRIIICTELQVMMH